MSPDARRKRDVDNDEGLIGEDEWFHDDALGEAESAIFGDGGYDE